MIVFMCLNSTHFITVLYVIFYIVNCYTVPKSAEAKLSKFSQCLSLDMLIYYAILNYAKPNLSCIFLVTVEINISHTTQICMVV